MNQFALILLAVAQLPSAPPEVPTELVAALREWRLAEARRRRVPAFRILSNRALTAIAQTCPRDESQLLRVNGMGPKRLERFGETILEIVRRSID